MIKKMLYPKTQRLRKNKTKVFITEKIDGSNLSIGKTNDGELFIAQRNYVFFIDTMSKLIESKDKLYTGLFEFIVENIEEISKIKPRSVIIGEWVSMGQIKYDDVFTSKFVMFAKANVTEELELVNLNYYRSKFAYSFENNDIISCIDVVRTIEVRDEVPSVEYLDELYEKYCVSKNRKIEGFIIIEEFNEIKKYVRLKNGKFTNHKA